MKTGLKHPMLILNSFNKRKIALWYRIKQNINTSRYKLFEDKSKEENKIKNSSWILKIFVIVFNIFFFFDNRTGLFRIIFRLVYWLRFWFRSFLGLKRARMISFFLEFSIFGWKRLKISFKHKSLHCHSVLLVLD